MIIAIDAMGGDFAPEQVVGGALRCLPQLAADILLVGRRDQITPYLPAAEADLPGLEIVEAPEVVGMADGVTGVLRSRSDSSVSVAVDLVRTGEADAVVSAGNSGALMALAHTRLGTIAGLRRPAIAVLLPGLHQQRVLIDGGANVDCRPLDLAQFGLMGSIYAEHALGINQPRVGLLSIGQEPSKGNNLTQAAYELLSQSSLNFIGNVEGNDVLGGEVDVIVADGFAGNVALKAVEGAFQLAVDQLLQQISQSLQAKIGAWMMRHTITGFKRRFDYATYGGALLLGVRGICVVSHGRSDANAMANAIRVACWAAEGQVVERLQETCGQVIPSVTG